MTEAVQQPERVVEARDSRISERDGRVRCTDLVRCIGLSNQLLDNLNVMKRLHGERWPEVMADLGTALQLHMKATGETNAINAALPIAKKMSDAGENPMVFIAVATEIANTPNEKLTDHHPK